MNSDVKPSRLIYPMPFASGANAAYTPISNTATAATPNFPEGFPSSFSSPHSAAGKYVTRGMINALGRLATQNDFYRMCGGINEFDPDFAILIGGYPLGAILDYYESSSNSFTKVVSRTNNNMVDYRGITPTDAQAAAGVKSGGVDTTYWSRINTTITGTGNPVVTFASSYPAYSQTPVGMFKADKTGILEFVGDYTIATGQITGADGKPITEGAWARIVMVSGDTTMSSASVGLETARSQNKATVVFDLGCTSGNLVSTTWPFLSSVEICQGTVVAGNYYALWMTSVSILIGNAVTGCSLKAYIR